MISTNHQARLNRERARSSQFEGKLNFCLLAVIAILSGFASGAFFKALEQSI